MIDYLRDTIWQFIGVIFSFIAILISVVIFVAQRKRKELSYEIISITPLLSVAKEAEEKLEIRFEGKLVHAVHLIVMRIINTGHLPILPNDYINDVSVKLNGDEIIAAEIINANPDAIDATLEVRGTNAILSRSLLNSGDNITLKILISNLQGNIQVIGRIAGVKEINKYMPKFRLATKIILLLALLMFISGMLVTIQGFINDSPLSLVIGSAVMILSCLMLLLSEAIDPIFKKSFNSPIFKSGKGSAG